MPNLTRAVIYARYSSDLQRDASIEDQIRVCSEKASREGWRVVGTYTDRAASGASLANRPGMNALLKAAKSNNFEVALAEALDRLSRDQEDVAGIYKRLSYSDVSICTLAEGVVNELHIGLKGTMNALFLKDLASKIRRGQRGRIAAGFAAGGRAYGYQVVRSIDDGGDLIRGQRVIKDQDAQIVREIFEAYKNGLSPRTIAAQLNVRGVPGPKGGEWNASTINGHRGRRNGILQNDLYRGLLIYNRVRMAKNPETGKRISRPNPKSEWVTVEVPQLRIIPDELWERVQARKASYGTRRPETARRPKRLLSGLLVCGECGGSFTIARPGKYGCATHRERGTCSNGRQISVNQLERRVLAGLKQHLCNPELLVEFVREFNLELNRLRAAASQANMTTERRLEELQAKIERIVQAITEGTDSPSLRDTLMRLESEKAAASKSLPHPKARRRRAPVPRPEILFKKKIATLEEALSSDEKTAAEAGLILRSLVDHITIRPASGRGALLVEIQAEPAELFVAASGNLPDPRDRMITVVAEEGLEPPTRGL